MINFLNTPDLIQQRAEIEIIVKVAIVKIESTIILAKEILLRVKVVSGALIVIVGINAVVVIVRNDSAIATLAEGILFRVEADSVALVVNIPIDSAIAVALVVHLVKDRLH